MIISTNPADNAAQSSIIVSWSESLATGIDLIDEQHKHLVALTNELYQACLLGGDKLETVFRETMSRMVEYVRFHFTSEQAMLQRVKYPKYAEHKAEHDNLIKTVLETTKDYSDSKKFVPNNFVRYLKDWIVGHIGHADKMYVLYVNEQKKKGLLSDKDITG